MWVQRVITASWMRRASASTRSSSVIGAGSSAPPPQPAARAATSTASTPPARRKGRCSRDMWPPGSRARAVGAATGTARDGTATGSGAAPPVQSARRGASPAAIAAPPLAVNTPSVNPATPEEGGEADRALESPHELRGQAAGGQSGAESGDAPDDPPPGHRRRGAERQPLRRAQPQAGERPDERQPAESAEHAERRQAHRLAGQCLAERLDQHDAYRHADTEAEARGPDP